MSMMIATFTPSNDEPSELGYVLSFYNFKIAEAQRSMQNTVPLDCASMRNKA